MAQVNPEDFEDFDLCGECKGSCKYTGFWKVEDCPTCEGAGWVAKGEGLTEDEWEALEADKSARSPW